MFALLLPLVGTVFAQNTAQLQTIADGYISGGTANAQCNTLASQYDVVPLYNYGTLSTKTSAKFLWQAMECGMRSGSITGVAPEFNPRQCGKG
jgi:hypothetical protein